MNTTLIASLTKINDMKIHEIKMYQEFPAPIATVWEAFNNHENFGKMMGQKVIRIKDSEDPTNINGLHSVRLLALPLAPFEETIRKSEKPTCIEYQITKGTPLHHHYGRMIFSELPNGNSALDYSIELGSKFPFVTALLAVVLKKGIGSGIKNYARRLTEGK